MIDIRDFGAVSGAPDSSSQIQAALDTAQGEPVYFPPGTWNAEGLILRPQSHIFGASDWRSILKRKSGSTTFLMASEGYASNATVVDLGSVIRDMRFDGSKPDSNYATGRDGLILRTYRSAIERCRFTNAAGHGLLLTALSANGTPITNGMAENRILNNRFDANNGAGLYGRDGTANQLADLFIRGNAFGPNGGSSFYNLDLERCAGSHISDNHLYGVSRGDMRLLKASALTVAGNNMDATYANAGSGKQYTCYIEFGGWVQGQIVGNAFHNRRASPVSGVTYIHLGLKKVSGTPLGVVYDGNTFSHQFIDGQSVEEINFSASDVLTGDNTSV